MSVAARLTARDFVKQPWKNGGGTTMELAAHPAGSRPLWRLSVAEVSRSGPFSDYSGYMRTIMLLEGDGMRLTFDRAEPAIIDRPLRPYAFDGAWKCDCELLGGAVRDMNLMVDREAGRGSIEIVWPREPLARTVGADWTLFYMISGNGQVVLGEREYRLAPGELLRLDGPSEERMWLSCGGPDPALAIVEVQRQRK